MATAPTEPLARSPLTKAVPIPRFAMEQMHGLGKCTPYRFHAFKERTGVGTGDPKVQGERGE